jgi:hypothetical protein
VPLVPVTHQCWLFSPPLELPLQLLLETGRFDSLRRRKLEAAPPCTTTQVIPADDPSNPTGGDVYFSHGLHQAVDLASEPGNCVFAAYSGRVVKVEVQPGGNTANVSIDHHPEGLGFVTNYNHVDEVQVAVGDFVREGEPFALVAGNAGHPAAALRALGGRRSQGHCGRPAGRQRGLDVATTAELAVDLHAHRVVAGVDVERRSGDVAGVV